MLPFGVRGTQPIGTRKRVDDKRNVMTSVHVDRYRPGMKLALAAALLLLVAGCGSSFGSAAEVAKAGGCSNPQPDETWDSGTNPFADQGEMVTCQFRGHELRVAWFKSKSARDGYKAVADSVSDSFDDAGDDSVVFGDTWSVECNDAPRDCDRFRDAVG